MNLIYSNIIDDNDWFDSSFPMLSWGDVKNALNGSIDESNFMASSNFTMRWIKTNEPIYCDHLLEVKTYKMKIGQSFTMKDGSTAIITLTT